MFAYRKHLKGLRPSESLKKVRSSYENSQTSPRGSTHLLNVVAHELKGSSGGSVKLTRRSLRIRSQVQAQWRDTFVSMHNERLENEQA